MAGKRTASSELSHLNWDRDEEPEDAGTFKRANEEQLKQRVIKTARRKGVTLANNTSGSEDTEKKSIFSGFTGFAKAPVSNASAFSFLNSMSKPPETSKTNGTTSEPEKPKLNTSTSTENQKDHKTESSTTEFLGKLKGLNEGVASWIKQHVDENPLVSLKPIFKDYEKYYDELEKEEEKRTAEGGKKEGSSAMANFVFKKAENVPVSKTTSTSPLVTGKTFDGPQFSFGSGPTASTVAPTFSFGSNKTSTSPSRNQFSFGSNAHSSSAGAFGGSHSTFSFATKATSPSTTTTTPASTEEQDEDEPPKVEFVPVVEDNHIFTTRCKVFVKKGGNFGDRGVGNLFLKPIHDSDKKQLIVRADTNLGNLLCNFILSDGLPMQRMGKKDVMLVCLPTPDEKPPPVPILLRVKSPEAADELLDVLQKHKK